MQKSKPAYEDAIRFFTELPRTLGKDAQGAEVTADLGKYGPYVRRGGDFRSIPGSKALFTVTLEEAIAILDKPKTSKPKKTSK